MFKQWNGNSFHLALAGIEQGIEQGIERERLKGICNLMKNLSFSTEQAMEALEIPVKDREKYHLMLQ